MKISCKTLLPAFSILALVSCSDDVKTRASRYMAETNRTQAELEEITKYDSKQLIQAKLDSTAYRDIFNSTQAANDSANIENFNKVAASMCPQETQENIYKNVVPEYMNSWHSINEIDKRLKDKGITVKEFATIKDKDKFFKSDDVRVNSHQHYADDWAYRNFFKYIGILNDTIVKKCDEVSKKIRPY